MYNILYIQTHSLDLDPLLNNDVQTKSTTGSKPTTLYSNTIRNINDRTILYADVDRLRLLSSSAEVDRGEMATENEMLAVQEMTTPTDETKCYVKLSTAGSVGNEGSYPSIACGRKAMYKSISMCSGMDSVCFRNANKNEKSSSENLHVHIVTKDANIKKTFVEISHVPYDKWLLLVRKLV